MMVVTEPASSAPATLMHSVATPESPRPWFRQKWPWLLMVMPALALVGGFVTLWLAITSNHALVVDDYYRQGKAINLEIARDQAAQRRHLSATLADDPAGLVLSLDAAGATAMPGSLKLHLMHSTRDELDQRMLLVRDGDGRYRAPGHRLPRTGRWRLQIEPAETGDWRLVALISGGSGPVRFGDAR